MCCSVKMGKETFLMVLLIILISILLLDVKHVALKI